MNRFTLLLLCIFQFHFAFSQADWSTSIAGIIYSNCSTCHHDGGIAPISFMSYEEAAINAYSIQSYVNSNKMPPWPADPTYSHFRDERVLTDAEKAQINAWVVAGLPPGDTTLAPDPPVFDDNVMLDNPDDSLILPAFILFQNDDSYRCFAVHSNYTTTKYLNEVEVIPGNAAAVHHLFLFHDTSSISYDLDVSDPKPGFYGGFLDGFSPYAELDMGWTPGSTIFSLPENMGMRILPGSDFIVSIHYAPGHIGEKDSTKVYLKWSDAPNVRPITNYRFLHWHEPSLQNPPFVIPANTITTFYEQSNISTVDKSLLALQPHMHLIGKSFEVYMVTAPGDTTGLIYIPDWNFYWQLGYFVTQVIKVPAGAQFFGTGVFDNTVNNPNNPSNPPITVEAGESTFDEMMSCRFWMMDYQPGDEHIFLDSSVYTSEYHPIHLDNLEVQIFPDPVDQVLHFVTSLPEHNIRWSLTNQLGMVAREENAMNIPNGICMRDVDVADLPAGVYLLVVQSGLHRTVKQLVID
jgi:hypothetical protein